MRLRRIATMIAMAVGCVSAALSAAPLTASADTPPPPNSIVEIRLTNAPNGLGFAGVKDNGSADGTVVWTIGSGGNAIRWVTLTGPNGTIEFADLNHQNMCMGQFGGSVVLKSCGNETTLWTATEQDGPGWFIRNQYRSGVEGTDEVLTSASDASETPLGLNPEGTQGSWQNWTFISV